MQDDRRREEVLAEIEAAKLPPRGAKAPEAPRRPIPREGVRRGRCLVEAHPDDGRVDLVGPGHWSLRDDTRPPK